METQNAQQNTTLTDDKKKTAECITIHKLNLYFRAMLINTALDWYKIRHVDHWNKTEDSDISLHNHQIFDEEARDIHWGKKRQHLQQMVLVKLDGCI